MNRIDLLKMKFKINLKLNKKKNKEKKNVKEQWILRNNIMNQNGN